MAEHEVTGQKKQEKADQNKRILKENPQPISQKLIASDTSSYLGETPFVPPVQRHADLLLNASSEQPFYYCQ